MEEVQPVAQQGLGKCDASKTRQKNPCNLVHFIILAQDYSCLSHSAEYFEKPKPSLQSVHSATTSKEMAADTQFHLVFLFIFVPLAVHVSYDGDITALHYFEKLVSLKS